jgi:asparagine synthase (glutamine-hydrolysing)
MCGICGIFNYRSGQPASQALLGDMTAAIAHRGPDDDGHYFDGALGMGMRRLSIVDLEGGAQPISGEDGCVTTVFNGEIYNHPELKTRLEGRGHVYRTRADTETVVHAYEEWGFGALRQLNGMFGIAIWDAGQQQLVLARDPYGVKPLYYRDDGYTLRFASEIRSILCDPSVPREVDPEALDHFLSFTFVPAPRTGFAGILKMPPGHALVCTRDGCSLRRFHEVIPTALLDDDEEALVERLRGLIVRAVDRQMMSDVPVGALLSGGVDSTAIASIMTEVAGGPIDTFTVGFSGQHDLDETLFARETSQRLGSRHHEVIVSADDYADYLPQAVWHLEDLVATDSTMAYAQLCRLARESVKVVLSGQGADEPFAGYPRHLGERYGGWLRAAPSPVFSGMIAPAVELLPRNERLKRAVRSLGSRDPAARMAAVWTIVDSNMKQRLYLPGRRPADTTEAAAAVWQADVKHLDGLTQMLYVDSRFSLADNLLLYGDKLSMAVSLETRVPLLDLELMRFVESLSPRMKIRGLTRKYLLRRAVATWVPREVLQRKKIPFQSPIDRWLRSDLTDRVREALLRPDSACAEFFQRDVLNRMIDDHVVGREDYKRALLAFIVFELWHEQFVRPSGGELRHRILAADAAAGRRER